MLWQKPVLLLTPFLLNKWGKWILRLPTTREAKLHVPCMACVNNNSHPSTYNTHKHTQHTYIQHIYNIHIDMHARTHCRKGKHTPVPQALLPLALSPLQEPHSQHSPWDSLH